jgi:HPt (histidine-containing phosphotransfer) domain-containing protein
MAEAAVLDQSVIASLRQLTPPGEPDVLTEVLQMFLHEVPPRIDRLRNAWASGNIEELYRSAHSLKGSAGNVGAQRLYEVCKQLDDAGRSGDVANSAPLVEALGIEYGKVEAEIHLIIGHTDSNS